MVHKNPQGFIGKLLKAFATLESSRLFQGIKAIQMRISSQLIRLVPARLLWLLPFLEQEIKVKPPTLEQLKDKVLRKPGEKEVVEVTESGAEVVPQRLVTPQIKSLYPDYRCVEGNTFACEWPQKTLEQQADAKYCIKCGFPALLAPETKIQGIRGRYQIEGVLNYRGRGRIYQAFQLPDRQPVIIKEYLLPARYFNPEETRQRKDAFVKLAGLSLADGRIQDFRLIPIWDAIADQNQERCYLVTKGNLDSYSTLANYLIETGSLTSYQVRQLLNQVLQSLEFLHSQKFRLPSGLVQEGLVDGNISLESLLIGPSFQEGFFIYLCDLFLWEGRFAPPLEERPILSVAKDLKDLGYVAFYLLAGGTNDPVNGQLFNPKMKDRWPIIHPGLKDFILSLMGMGMAKFETAEIARQALLRLPPEPQIDPTLSEGVIEEEAKKKKRRFPIPIWLMWLIGLLLLLSLLWYLFGRNLFKKQTAPDSVVCCIEQVSGIPAGNFKYTAEKNSPWDYVLQQPNLIAKETTLAQELYKRQPKLQLLYQPEPLWVDAIQKVRTKESEFAIATLVNNLTSDLGYENVAHDGLVFFVAFSYARRNDSLPSALNGQITFEQLRQLYTGKINKWQQIGGPDVRLKLYLPLSEEAIQIFEERVLKDKSSIDNFRKLAKQSNQISPTSEVQVKRLQTGETLRGIIRDFEDSNIGAIGFDSLSRVLGQCSVYPLALINGNNPPISPLIQNNNQPVTPRTDLCNAKGSYGPNVEAFISQNYPLAYPLSVIYPRDNSRKPVGEKFAEILKTSEAQELLYKTGLVPLEALK
ncbi:substrate-binding domain-containing protein [Limnofasciculus baicalensis]|uniref:Substrate-binding domain-containing protein n=1 Tax=Limnofasciculus baicalensis BBK-W-15 TaxID=2699891 RepID=A0AAE3GVC2_9CYAN|nr:substrate-binding domain-containing protein [Limnofasciculus baicalensis]MCP2730641.1 substrate-binding domain-containing protein [Limnofasciculus baicalensis BBK-W-15]